MSYRSRSRRTRRMYPTRYRTTTERGKREYMRLYMRDYMRSRRGTPRTRRWRPGRPTARRVRHVRRR